MSHAATRLSSGKVLVEGGSNETLGTLASAELYDPSSGTWSAAASLATARAAHTATTLMDGRVLVVGGANGSGAALNTVERYDAVSVGFDHLVERRGIRSHQRAPRCP